MRLLILVLGLACLFGLASLWHLQRVGEAREELAAARELAAGRSARTEVGVVPEGWAVVMVGEPSGAEPVAAPAAPDGAPQPPPEKGAGAPEPTEQPGPGRTDSGPGEPGKLDLPVPPQELGDFEMSVQPGESLSKICKARYGSAAPALVRALARYNELASPDSLQIGQRLRLPAPEKLKRLAATKP